MSKASFEGANGLPGRSVDEELHTAVQTEDKVKVVVFGDI
jgi:hypothetical protein